MCDPITIAGIAASVGGTVVNSMAQQKAAAARDDVLAAERVRQKTFDQEAHALNAQSQDRYQGFEAKQADAAKTLGDYFAAAPDSPNATAGATMPSASSDIVVREMAKQSGKARAFTDQQGGALADMRSFGDLLGDVSRMQGRDASLVGQVGGFKRGSSGVLPLELNQASRAGDSTKALGDILYGLGGIGTTVGLNGGARLYGSPGSVANGIPTPAQPSMFTRLRRNLTPATNFLGS